MQAAVPDGSGKWHVLQFLGVKHDFHSVHPLQRSRDLR